VSLPGGRLAVTLSVLVLGGGACAPPQPSESMPPPSSPAVTASDPSPSSAGGVITLDCAGLQRVTCDRIVEAAHQELSDGADPVEAWLGPPIESHFPVPSGSFRGTVLFRLSSGDFRVVLVTSIAGQGIGARELEGPIPSWYPLPSPT
jgi:hypothetical protein